MEQRDEFNPYAAPILAEPVEALGSQRALQQVAAGFNLVYWAIVTWLLCIIVVVFTVIGARALGPLAVYVFGATIIVAIAGWLMNLVGKCFCMAVPSETRLRPVITASVACLVAWILAGALFVFVYRTPAVRVVGGVLAFCSQLLFLIFIKRVAGVLARPDLMDRAQTVIVLNIIVDVVFFLMGVLTPHLGINGAPVILLGSIAIVVLFLVYVVLYTRLLVDSRKAILGTY